MRGTKHTFKWTEAKFTNFETKEVVLVKKYTKKMTKPTAMQDFMKNEKYAPVTVELEEVVKTFIQDAETYMKHGTEVLKPMEDVAPVKDVIEDINETSDTKEEVK